MAKNSNKKVCRTRNNQKEAKKREALERQRRRDAFDEDFRRDNIIRSNFYGLLRDACYNPVVYTIQQDYRNCGIHDFAGKVISRKFGALEKRALSTLIEVCKRSKIIDSNSQYINNYVVGLMNLAKWEWMWQNNPELWIPSSKNPKKQFSSLVRFLFCKYSVPEFMDKAWLKDGGDSLLHQEWFINLGLGENIRKQKRLPIPYTKKMAHYFLQAPSHCNIMNAIRWGHVLGMGGDRRTALAILETPLGESFGNNEFWTSVIQFFIDNPMLDTNQYGPIYDFINNQKFRDRGQVYVDNQLVYLGAIQPNFSMHRRDPNALIRQVEEWHINLRRDNRTGEYNRRVKLEWSSCGIPGYCKVPLKHSKVQDTVEITELLSSDELYVEGSVMKHCVGSYSQSCYDRHCAIYSLRKKNEHSEKYQREATIEVRISDRTITQGRKSCNGRLTESDWRYINEWATNANLKISSWLL
ncbi:MAG: PcfJ domain-containing protein [Synergistaceae bacterium]